MSTFCLVSGSTQDPRCWRLLTPEIERRGHRVVTASLPTDERDVGLVARRGPRKAGS